MKREDVVIGLKGYKLGLTLLRNTNVGFNISSHYLARIQLQRVQSIFSSDYFGSIQLTHIETKRSSDYFANVRLKRVPSKLSSNYLQSIDCNTLNPNAISIN